MSHRQSNQQRSRPGARDQSPERPRGSGNPGGQSSQSGGGGQGRAASSARQVALDALLRIEHDGAYANLLVPSMLDRSKLTVQDRRFVTELVYGATRMRRACSALFERFVMTDPDPEVRTLLGLGAYQLAFAGVPPHAAVGETVELAHPKVRGFVNAVLRKVANTPMIWSDDADRLSYPDWIVARFVRELGEFEGLAALECMNEAPQVSVRDDGYIQDRGSQWVADLVDVQPGETVLDLCAAPGGKATSMAGNGAFVVAADLQPHRAALVVENAHRLGYHVPVVVADGKAPPFAPASFDRVLIDAPCSGLGSLRRRPDARWRITSNDVDELATIQAQLLAAAAPLVKPGGSLVYSVCTITAAESVDHATPDGFDADTSAVAEPWQSFGTGHRLLPQDADTDGMVIVRYRARA